MAALLVEPREAKRVRATAEQLGVFDPSRKIGPYAGSEYNNTEAKKLLALPVILPPSSEHGQQQQTEDLLKAYPLVQDATLLPSASALSKERSPRQTIVAALQQLLSSQAAPAISKARREQLLQSVPSRWEEHGDLLLLPCNSFSEPEWRHFGERFDPLPLLVLFSLLAFKIAHVLDVSSINSSHSLFVCLTLVTMPALVRSHFVSSALACGWCAMLCYAVLCCAVLCCAVLCCAWQAVSCGKQSRVPSPGFSALQSSMLSTLTRCEPLGHSLCLASHPS